MLEHSHESGFLALKLTKLLGTFDISSDTTGKAGKADKHHRAKRKVPLGLVLRRRPRRKMQTAPKQQQQQLPKVPGATKEKSAPSRVLKTAALGPQSLEALLGIASESDKSASTSSSSASSKSSSSSKSATAEGGLLSDQDYEEYHGIGDSEVDRTEAAADQAQVQEAAARANTTLFGKLGLDSVGWAVTGCSLCAICNRRILKGSCRFSFYHHIRRPSRWMHSTCFKSYYDQSSTLIQDQARIKLSQLAQESPVEFQDIVHECRAFVM